MKSIARVFLAAAVLFVCGNIDIFGQKTRTPRRSAPSQPAIVFAVLNDGKLLEPVAAITGSKLVTVDMGPNEDRPSKTFITRYFPAGKSYTIIFGGKPNGTATVIKSNSETECGRNTADAASKTLVGPLKGMVMSLATNANFAKPGSGIRRRPTVAEREEIEALVREEFQKHGTGASVLKGTSVSQFDRSGLK